MFNRETILKNLNAENYFIDKHSLSLFLNDWKIDSIYEDGMVETDFILTGTTEESWFTLQQEKEKIEKLFRDRTTILESGIGLSISFERSLIVPTESDTLKRIQINLSVKEWRNY